MGTIKRSSVNPLCHPWQQISPELMVRRLKTVIHLMMWMERLRKKLGILAVNMRYEDKMGIVKTVKPREMTGMVNTMRLVKPNKS
jgi:hypothetical protein